jgi:anaerobic selenocysteine-containing dehydrogenase
MKTRKEIQQVARRDLLKIAGLGGVAGAAAVATSAGKAEAAAELDTKSSGYRETEHVRTYYDLAKF